MSLLQLGPIIFGSTQGIIDYLRQHGVLAANKTHTRQVCTCLFCNLSIQTFNCVSLKYTSCGIAMRERNRRDITDGICWYCPSCKTTKSIRDGSFFAKSRLLLQKWMIVIYWWARQYSVNNCKDEAEIDKHNAIDMYQWLREVCSARLLQDPPIVLGGQGAIDESLFRHKPKVTACTHVHPHPTV